MVDEIREVREEQPERTVIVERDNAPRSSGIGAVIAIIVLLAILYLVFFVWNPFTRSGNNDIDVNVPTPNVNVTPSEGSPSPNPGQ